MWGVTGCERSSQGATAANTLTSQQLTMLLGQGVYKSQAGGHKGALFEQKWWIAYTGSCGKGTPAQRREMRGRSVYKRFESGFEFRNAGV